MGDRGRRGQLSTDHFLFSWKCSAEAVCIPLELSPTSQMVSKCSAITDRAVTSVPLTHGHTVFPAVKVLLWNELTPSLSPGVWSWVFLYSFPSLANSVTKINLILYTSWCAKLSRFMASRLPRCFQLPFIPFQLFLLSTLVLLFSAQSLIIPFPSAPSASFFPFLLISFSVCLSWAILPRMQVSIASSSSCQIIAPSLYTFWIRVIPDTQILRANLRVSSDTANTQSRTNSSGSGSNQNMPHFLVHQWPPSSPSSWDSKSMKEAQELYSLSPPERTLWQAISCWLPEL